MMTTLLLAATLIVQSGETPRWITLSNLPGWEGYGVILPSGWISPERFRRTADPATEVPPAGAVLASPSAPTSVAAPISGTDPHGFTGWLNGMRASNGLPAVGYDPALSNWAAMNNAAQAAHGLGHHVMGPARRQNSGMGAAASVWPAWVASPAHAAALFDPTIRWIGIAWSGAYWTFSAY